MKVFKIIANIFGIILALFVSLFTFSVLISTPALSTGTKILQPEAIQDIIEDMELSEQLESLLQESAPDDFRELDITFIDDLMSSDLMSDILELYIDNLMGILENDQMESINQTQIHKLLDKHMPDMVIMIRKSLPSEVPITEDELTDYAFETVEPALFSMVSNLPNLEDLGVDDNLLSIIHKLYQGTLLKISIVLISLLSVLIILLRFPRFKGFLWLGITYLLAAVTLVFLSGQIDIVLENVLPEEAIETLGFAIEPIIKLVKNQFHTYARNIAIFSAIFILIFVVGRVLLAIFKKKTLTNPTPTVQSMQ